MLLLELIEINRHLESDSLSMKTVWTTNQM